MSKIFAERLRKAREERRKTQRDVARFIGISDVGYGGWERGDAEPSIDNLAKLCRFLSVPAAWLIGVEEEPRVAGIGVERLIEMNADIATAVDALTRLKAKVANLEKDSHNDRR